jgi:hypothetical protein
VEEVETPDMLKLAVDYYKILSAKEEKLDILLMDFFREPDEIWLMRRKMLCLMLLFRRKRARSQCLGHIC